MFFAFFVVNLAERDPMKDMKELSDRVRQIAYDIHLYHGHGHLEKVYENALVHRPEHEAQILGYLKSSRLEHGLLINFGFYKFEIRKFMWSKHIRPGRPGRKVFSRHLSQDLLPYFSADREKQPQRTQRSQRKNKDESFLLSLFVFFAFFVVNICVCIRRT